MTAPAWTRRVVISGLLWGQSWSTFLFLQTCHRCDDPEEPGSPICQKDVSDPTTSTPYTTTYYPTTTTSYPYPTTTPEYNKYKGQILMMTLTWFFFRPTIELHGGSDSGRGNVYANNRNGYFGPVCDDGWGPNEAKVVCRYAHKKTRTYLIFFLFSTTTDFHF